LAVGAAHYEVADLVREPAALALLAAIVEAQRAVIEARAPAGAAAVRGAAAGAGIHRAVRAGSARGLQLRRCSRPDGVGAKRPRYVSVKESVDYGRLVLGYLT
jgi:hypothetical protein